jgi:hypothetical protein
MWIPRLRSVVARRSLLAASALLLSIPAEGQVVFAHMTDPHLFDAEAKAEADNLAALQAFITDLNRKTKPDFVVVTGDLGIEGIVGDGPLTHTHLDCPSADREAPELTAELEAKLAAKAGELAGELLHADATTWLFVPGNNDVWNEKHRNRKYYDHFLEALEREMKRQRAGTEVVDLMAGWSPKTPSGRFRFLGLDNSSFKNNDSHECMVLNSENQREDVEDFAGKIAEAEAEFVYVFYHIPEIDDPYLDPSEEPGRGLAAKLVKRSSQAHPRSAWLVGPDVWKAWIASVVDQPRVRGLFAGHFHSDERARYEDLCWAKGYPPGVYDKLSVAPPLAEKFQHGSQTARGYQVVSLLADGSFTRKIRWYDPVARSFGEPPVAPGSDEDRCICLVLLFVVAAVGVIGLALWAYGGRARRLSRSA